MTRTYRFALALLLSLLPGLASSQSLEVKAAEMRRLQAQSQTGYDLESIDTMALPARKKPQAGRGAAARKPLERMYLDSVLSGPLPPDSLERIEPDTIWVRDSLGALVPMLNPKKTAKRYEQRIFQSVDAAAFSSAAGSAGREYVLGPGDEILVSLWGDKEKEYAVTLNNEGKVFLEGIGMVALSGSNLDQALQTLKQRFARIYSGIGRGTTHVDVTLGKAGPVRVFVLGEVKVPGGYVFTGHTSMLSAFYFAKGPTDIGTVRNVQLTRSGAKFSLDLYNYLLKGESLSPHSLQDGDILFAGRAYALVEISGDVGRPATYEIKKGEGIKELLEYAGGLNPTAAGHRLSLQRLFDTGRPDFVDLAPPQDYLTGKARFDLKDGDKLLVEKSVDESGNFITISGPVKYPGTYEAHGIKSVKQLVAKAGGLQEEAYLGRVHVLRFHPSGTSSLFAYSLEEASLDTIGLKPKDNVILYSLKDMHLPDSVQIAGAVFRPGTFEFREGMTAKDLVMQAGGFLPNHKAGTILVFRGSDREQKVEQIKIEVRDGLDKSESGFTLHPNDLVQIPVDPGWYQKEIVVLDGLFLHPGKYALLYPGEKLSSVVERAGGFKENAYVQGGRFYRSRDSVGRVGIDILKAIQNPKSKGNISLAGGDSIFIPGRLNTVKVIGEVGFETSVLYKSGATVQYYIEKAGGYTRRSEKKQVVVQYANGETGREGYFNRNPDGGSVIFVPRGPEPKPVDWVASLNALLGTLGVAAALILSIQAISQ